MLAERAAELVSAYSQAIGARPWLVGGAGAESIRVLVEQRGGRVTGAAGDAMTLAEMMASPSRS